MATEAGKATTTTIAIRPVQREQAERIIELGYAASFSEAVRFALSFTANSVPCATAAS